MARVPLTTAILHQSCICIRLSYVFDFTFDGGVSIFELPLLGDRWRIGCRSTGIEGYGKTISEIEADREAMVTNGKSAYG